MKTTKKDVAKSIIVRLFILLAIMALIYIVTEVLRTPQTIEQIVQETRAEQQFIESCQSLKEDDMLISELGRVFYVYLNTPEGMIGTKCLTMSPSAQTDTYQGFYHIYGACRVVESGSDEWVQIIKETF